MRVLKFGGTSVADPARLASVARIVARAAQSDRLVVVTSAQAGVTNDLAAAADRGDADGVVPALAQRHFACLHATSGPQREAAAVAVQQRLEELTALLARPPAGGDRPAWRDAVLACGERLAAPVVAAFLNAAGVAATPVDAADLVVTDSSFGEAVVDDVATQARARRWFMRLAPGTVPVVTGFLGAAPDGRTTTLGRGGSDYSAALLGAALGAACIEIWTDVAGILSAPPRIVPEAVPLPAVSFAVARELAALGGKVLHPKTMDPAERAGVPIAVRSTIEPGRAGTVVGPPSPAARRALIVTGVEAGAAVEQALALTPQPVEAPDVCLVGVVAEGVGRRPGTLARHKALVDQLRLPTLAVVPSPSGHAVLSLHRRIYMRRVIARLHAALVLGATPCRTFSPWTAGRAARLSSPPSPDGHAREVGP